MLEVQDKPPLLAFASVCTLQKRDQSRYIHTLTTLQAHCSFFDPDGDGVVWPQDTLMGFHAIGFNWLVSVLAVIVLHPTFAYWTQTSWCCSVFLPPHLTEIGWLESG